MDKLNNVREGLVSPTEAFSDDRCGWDITQDAIRAQANAAERHCHILLRQSFRQPICGLDEACLTGARLRLDRLPATASPDFLPLSAAPPFLAKQESRRRGPPLRCGPAAAPPVPR